MEGDKGKKERPEGFWKTLRVWRLVSSRKILIPEPPEIPRETGDHEANQPDIYFSLERPHYAEFSSELSSARACVRMISEAAKMNERIVIDPRIQHGKPVIRGTRVPVARIVGGLAGGMTVAEVVHEYGVSNEDVCAALSYAAALVEEEVVYPLAILSPVTA